VSVQHVINSRQNNVTGVKGEVLGVANDLMLRYAVYVNPVPNLVALTSEVYCVWSSGQDEIAELGARTPRKDLQVRVTLP